MHPYILVFGLNPMLLLLLFFFFFLFLLCFVATVHKCVVIPSSAPPDQLGTWRSGLNLKGCCVRLQNVPPVRQRHQTEGRVTGLRLMSVDKSGKHGGKKAGRSWRGERESQGSLVEQQLTALSFTDEQPLTSSTMPTGPHSPASPPSPSTERKRLHSCPIYYSVIGQLTPKSAIFNTRERISRVLIIVDVHESELNCFCLLLVDSRL